MCKVSKATKKKEAIKRMEVLGLFKHCIKAFTKYDEVQLSEQTGGLYEFSDDYELNEKVKEFENEHDALVYHVIHTYTEFGELYSFLYVSDHEEEWDMDREDLYDGYIIAYVWNKTDDYLSEFGGIMVKERIGGLVRTA